MSGYPSTYTGTTSCYAGTGSRDLYQANEAYSDSVVSITAPGVASDYFYASLSGDAVANPSANEPPPGSVSNANAMASGTISLELNTAGPVRSGYIQLVVSGMGAYGTNGGDFINFSIGSISGGCSGSSYGNCASPLTVGPFTGGSFLLPFTLGQPFLLQMDSTLTSSARYVDGPVNGEDSESIQFRFLEADGVTPVAIIPEPSTTWFTGLALIGILATLAVRRFSMY